MPFWVTKAKRKGLAKKLRICLESIRVSQTAQKYKQLTPILDQINETFIQPEFQQDDLPHILNGKIYRDHTVAMLIGLLPFFDQPTINAISTLFQTTIREFPDESLPKYLIEHTETLDQLLSYFNQPNISNSAHIILRSCAIVTDFTRFLFQNGCVGSFVQYLSSDNFDHLSTAFATYECLLMIYPDVTAEYFSVKWQIFAIQIKQLMSSPNYLVQLTFLPILFRFITNESCKSIFFRFLDDSENLQLIMCILKRNSKKIQMHAYSIFKLFILNPRKAPPIVNLIKNNRSQLIKYLKDFNFDENDVELENEKQTLISTIANM